MAAKVSTLKHVVVFPGPEDEEAKAELMRRKVQVHSWEAFVSAGMDNVVSENAHCSPEDDAVIMYTSGTTGLPKGVILQHKAFIATIAGATSKTGSFLTEGTFFALDDKVPDGVLMHGTGPPDARTLTRPTFGPRRRSILRTCRWHTPLSSPVS